MRLKPNHEIKEKRGRKSTYFFANNRRLESPQSSADETETTIHQGRRSLGFLSFFHAYSFLCLEIERKVWERERGKGTMAKGDERGQGWYLIEPPFLLIIFLPRGVSPAWPPHKCTNPHPLLLPMWINFYLRMLLDVNWVNSSK